MKKGDEGNMPQFCVSASCTERDAKLAPPLVRTRRTAKELPLEFTERLDAVLCRGLSIVLTADYKYRAFVVNDISNDMLVVVDLPHR